MRLLILGSKEFPVGSGKGFDEFPSGGMERYVQDFSSGLAAMGHFPVVVTRKFASQRSFENKGGVEVARVGWAKGYLLRNASFNLSAFFYSLKLDFDVIFANGVFATLSGIALRFFRKKPVISRPAGIAWVQPQYNFAVKRILNALESFAYSHADAVVFLSRQEKSSFERKMGFLPKKYSVIHTGVDLKRFEKARKTARKKRMKTVLFLGRLLAVKGAKFLLDAAPKINAKIVIAGEGPEKKDLQKLAKERNLKNVVFTGQVEKPEELFAECDVFVLPSLSEGLPIAMLEAFASKKPCVVTDIGLPVENGKTALVVKPGNAEELASALNKLLKNEKLAARIAENGFQLARKNFTWKKACGEIISLAEGLV
ncbi:MAG: glycosyltransferase family 4 protein [Candidatus Micrarchaeota archaeon]